MAIEANKGKYTIVMGDFNAKVGECQPDEEAIMGKFGYGQRNKRGEMLLECAAQHKLVIGNTFFKKNKNRYWTWESPDGHTRNQIDFILSSQKGIIQDCGVITKVDIGSVHRMVRAKFQISKRLARLKFIRNEKKSKINID
ncbi:craniofacial development protein 2-like [Amphiura filiformis]|uniref:craniofacial development protein 2-like n=1 Tax=Amphiura filiformis TaxID=82378 RepID=UPI003B20EC90